MPAFKGFTFGACGEPVISNTALSSKVNAPIIETISPFHFEHPFCNAIL